MIFVRKQSKNITTFSDIKTKKKENVTKRKIFIFFKNSDCLPGITIIVIFD